MKYLCIAYDDDDKLNALPKEEFDRLINESLAYRDSLQRSGRLVVAEALQPTQSATTVRVRDGKASMTDGPFAETKEQVGGFWLIEARDLNEALQVASKIPSARYGSVEVRPIEDLTAR
jgi:hypothetical protein